MKGKLQGYIFIAYKFKLNGTRNKIKFLCNLPILSYERGEDFGN